MSNQTPQPWLLRQPIRGRDSVVPVKLDLPTPNIEVDLVTANHDVTVNHDVTANHDVTVNHDAMAASYLGFLELFGAR